MLDVQLALLQAVDQEEGTDLDPSNTQAGGGKGGGGPPGGFRGPVSDSPPEIGSIQRASVRSIKPYGVFVQMEGFRSNALVHLSQVPSARSAAVQSSLHTLCHPSDRQCTGSCMATQQQPSK